jgi:predicted alpha/beta-fold hydrolase
MLNAKYLSLPFAGALCWFAGFRLPYSRFNQHTTLVLGSKETLTLKIRAIMDSYQPAWFYVHQSLGIIHSHAVQQPHETVYKRIAVAGPKGLVVYDTLKAASPSKKALLIVPGVCGNSKENYIMDLAEQATANNYNILIINPIGPLDHCEGNLESLNFCENIVLERAVQEIRREFGPDSQVYACGFSLGANYLLRHLATHEDCSCNIIAAMSVSSAFDIPSSCV